MNTFIEPARGVRGAQKAETRERILAAARDHFESSGFEAANVRAIGASAGVAAGTVLLHFRDKRDLLHAALFDDLDRLIDEALAERTRARRFDRQLSALAQPFFAYYAARPRLSRTLLQEALLAEPPWRERYTAQIVRVSAHIAALADAAKARGELDAGANGPLLGAAFFSFYYFALLGWAQGALPSPGPLFDQLMAAHLHTVQPQKTSRAATKTTLSTSAKSIRRTS